MAKLSRTEAGTLTVCDPGADRPLSEIGTAQCQHCGAHFPITPGSGRVRGWCMNCNGPVCGPGCAECVPTDLYLSNIEAGRPANFRPIVASVPAWIEELNK